MDWRILLRDTLLAYVLFIPLLTLHEWAHAWTAWKCGDDTAFKRGRVSLNPIVHMDLVGTVILPLVGMIMRAMGGGIIFGWGKPVPVNPNNLRRPRLQDCLIAMAGPAMNLLLAFVLLGVVKLGLATGQKAITEAAAEMTKISLVLCFFNLIPIPPLDGSHLIFNLTRMRYQTYMRLSLVGFVAILALLQFRQTQRFLEWIVTGTFVAMAKIFRL
jgi:Zn-dependent protease